MSFDLAPQQRRLWRTAGDAGAYEARAVVRLEGDLDHGRLRRALAGLARRYEILRTRFPKAAWSKVPSQVIDDTPEIAWSDRPPGHGPFDLDAQTLQASLEADGPGRHRLTLRLTALAVDARSFEILVTELARLYAGEAPAGDPLQAADYAAWQAELLAPADPKGILARAFWGRHDLASVAQRLLPGEVRQPGDPYAPETIEIPVDGGALQALAAATGSSVPAVLLAGWAALLARYLGETAIVAGRLFDGRPMADLATAVGPLSRPLPVGLDCPGTLPFAELARRAAAAETEAAQLQEYGVGDEDTADERFAWLFEVRMAAAPVTAAGVTFALESAVAVAERAMAVVAEAGGDAWVVRLRYDASRLPAPEAVTLAQRLARLLAAAAASPDATIGDLDVLTACERRALLTEVAPGPALPPVELPAGTIHQAFTRQAGRTPGAPALSCAGRRLTYAEVKEESDRLARHLRTLGVSAEDRVGLFLERSSEAIVAMLGILGAGGAYVPLDPAFPRERLALMLEDAAPKVIVTDAAHAAALPPSGARLVRLDADREALRAAASGALPDTAAPESLAYVLFTSGSTGRPKGVAVEHRQVLAYTAAIVERMGSPAGQTWATVTTLAADLGNTMVFPALLGGGCLEVVTQEQAMEPAAFAELVASAGIDALKIVPSQLQALLAVVSPERVLPRRLLVLGGEAADWELVDRLAAPGCAPAVFNHYGPTEATVGVLAGRLEVGDREGRTERPALGRPLAGGRVLVLDEAGRLAPWGVAGELYLGGAGVARGYLGRPEATAERFLPDPHGPPGSRNYRTGDRARVLADGRLEFLGRLDGQIKLRGFRIEPGEIEAVLRLHPEVRDAAVVLREDVPGERRLVAYLAVRRGEEPAGAGLRAFLRDRLPESMVPAVFVPLAVLPLTPNGKLDRRALPAPGRGSEKATFATPRTPVEELLAGIWTQVLRVERVGIHDNFFELGGDSILAIQAIGKAVSAGIGLKPRDLFQHQTVAELAGAAGLPAVRTAAGPAGGTFPLTPIQRWFFDQGFADPHHWNQAVLLEPAAKLSPPRLAEALSILVAHHDALRLRFSPGSDGAWRQTYAEVETGELLVHHDLSGVAEPEAALEAAARALHASFDLGRGPLFGASLCDLRRGQRLLMAAHHLVVDGVSWRILIEDLAALVLGLEAGDEAPALPPRTSSFGAWSECLAGFAGDGRFSGELGLWRDMSASMPLPVDFGSPGDPAPFSTAGTATATLSVEETRRLLQEAPAALGADIQEVFLAGLALAVTGWTGRPELGLVVEGHGREEVAGDLDLTRTVGWFTTHHPLVLDLGARPDEPASVVRAVAARLRRIPHRGLGYGVLRYLAPDGKELAGFRPPDLAFNYLGQLDASLGDGSLGRVAREGSAPARSPHGHRERLFNAGAYVLGEQLHLTWSYTANHRQATAARLVNDFAAALRRILDETLGLAAQSSPSFSSLGGDLLARLARQLGTDKDRTPDAG